MFAAVNIKSRLFTLVLFNLCVFFGVDIEVALEGKHENSLT